jgi:hypothetical protein
MKLLVTSYLSSRCLWNRGLGPQQVELLPDENLQPQMKLEPRLQLDPARPADRAKKRSEDEKIPLESGAPDRKSKK